MDNIKIQTLSKREIKKLFPLLRHTPYPPSKLFVQGVIDGWVTKNKLLCVVGTRRPTEYGERVCRELIRALASYPVTIVSGLALGIDIIAHTTALEYGMHTIAIPGSGLDDDVLYPKKHLPIAHEIIEKEGLLISEFLPQTKAMPWHFLERNRIMAGISHATLIIECEKKSGTMVTGKLATDYNRDLLCVPGSIYNEMSEGPNFYIKLGAIPVTCVEDILEVLGIAKEKDPHPPK